MTPLVSTLASVIIAYLLGSLPFGYLVTWVARKIDLRGVGSGHTGGTNVLRAAGAIPAAITIVFDFCKGHFSVRIAEAMAPGLAWVAALAALAAVVGHVWSIFLAFKGGVGTMTTGGGAVALMPGGALASIAVSIVGVLIRRMSSVGSLLFALLLPVACLIGALLGYWPFVYLIFAIGSSAIAIWSLRANIQRLRDGTERRIGEQIPKGADDIKR